MVAEADKGNTMEQTPRKLKVGSAAEWKTKDDEALGPEMVEESSQTRANTEKLLSCVMLYSRNSEFRLGCIEYKVLVGTSRWRSSASH